MNKCGTCLFFIKAGIKEEKWQNRCSHGLTGAKHNAGIFLNDKRADVYVGVDYGCVHYTHSEFKARSR